MAPSRLTGLAMRFAVAAVAVLGPAATAARAQAPPPSGGFDTSACHGRGTHPPNNGRLIGRGRGKRGIFSVRPGGSGLRRETRPPRLYDDFYPAPSRDGRSIAFLRLYLPNVDDRPMRLMVMDLRTHKARLVTSDFFEEFAPAWSPDGEWITAGVVQTRVGGSFERTATVIHPDGSGRRNLEAGGYLLLNGSWSPNGRCFAADARFSDNPPFGYPGNQAGLAVLGRGGGRPNTFLPRPPCSSASGCVSTLPSFGPNAPNYVSWTADGRGILALRGVYRKPPSEPGAEPDEVDVMRSRLSSSTPGRVLLRKAIELHLAPDGRFFTAYSVRRRTFGVFALDGRLVHRFPRFKIDAWAAARR
jgi:hypothetical protein